MKSLLLVYALTCGGALLGLFRPFHGLLAYIALGALRPALLWPWAVPPGPYSKIVMLGVVIGWALAGFGNWWFIRKRTAIAFFGFWAVVAISALAAPNRSVAMEYLLLFCKILLPSLIWLTLVESYRDIRLTLWTFVLCFGVIAYEANLSYFQGFNRMLLYGISFGDNNTSSIPMVTGAGLAFFLGISETKWPLKLLAFACAGMMVHVPMLAESRGGLLGIVGLGIAATVPLLRNRRYMTYFAVAVVLGLMMAGPSVWEEFMTIFADVSDRDSSAQSRLDLWGQCFDAMIKNPILGLGPDHWPIAARTTYGWGVEKESHSLWFNTAAEFGIPGISLLLIFYFGELTSLLRFVWSKVQVANRESLYASAVLCSMFGTAIAISFVSLDMFETTYLLPFMSLAIIHFYQCEHITDLEPTVSSQVALDFRDTT